MNHCAFDEDCEDLGAKLYKEIGIDILERIVGEKVSVNCR